MTTNASLPLTPDRYAGFWVRFLAATLDLIAFTPLYLAVQWLLKSQPNWWVESVFGVTALCMYGWFFSSRWQASPGMYLCKFHICGIHGERIGFSKALFWGISSSVGWAICLVGVIYLQSRFDLQAVSDLSVSCARENLAPEDCKGIIENTTGVPYESYQTLLLSATGLALFLLLIWALSIGLAKDKTGFHNVLCGTRFVKGRV